MNLTIQYFDGCPNWQTAHERLRRVVDRMDLDATIELQVVASDEEAAALGFRGSPTVLVDGVDPFADPGAPVALSCRIYEGRTGAPSEQQLEGALSRASGR